MIGYLSTSKNKLNQMDLYKCKRYKVDIILLLIRDLKNPIVLLSTNKHFIIK